MNKIKEALTGHRHSTDAESSNSNYTQNTSNTTPEMSPRGNRNSTSGPSVTDKASDVVFGNSKTGGSGLSGNGGSLSNTSGPSGSAREAFANQKAGGAGVTSGSTGLTSNDRSSGLTGNSGSGLIGGASGHSGNGVTDAGKFSPTSSATGTSGTTGFTGTSPASPGRGAGGHSTRDGDATLANAGSHLSGKHHNTGATGTTGSGINDTTRGSGTGLNDTTRGSGTGINDTARGSGTGNSRLVDTNSTGTDSIGQAPRRDVGDSHTGRSTGIAQQGGTAAHSRGHNDKASPTDLNGEVHQDVQHLAHVTEETRQKHHIEEVTRDKDLQSHHHHVQHHVQQVRDTEHTAEQHHERLIPRTHINEVHASTEKDAELLNTVANQHGHRDRTIDAADTRQIVDKGENVRETVHHHVHNVIQPVIIKDSHEHHRHHVVIPTTHVAHHAPIIHESIMHDSISKADFLKSGGILGGKLTGVHQTGLLNDGKCDRVVEGVGEQMERELNLSPSQPH